MSRLFLWQLTTLEGYPLPPKRKSQKDPLHPGSLLGEKCFIPSGLTVTAAAKGIGISRQALNNILNGKAGITPEMAVRMSRFFGVRAETLQQWQRDYELGSARTSRAKVKRGLGDSFFVSSRDLVLWADSIDARYALPKLMRMLIHSTSATGSTFRFPAYEDAQLSGYDGIVDSPDVGFNVPKGKSVWELSTERRPSAKADSDYFKRLQNPLGYDPRQTTLVLVSLRRWADKERWAAPKIQAKDWAEVRVYDAIDLEHWLELVPQATVWLANRLNLSAVGAQSLESFWSEYSRSASPPLAPALLLAGREKETNTASQWLQTGSGVLRVLADSSDEGLAFIAAVGIESSVETPFTNSIVVVRDAEQARQFLNATHPVTFGWLLEDPSLLGTIVDRGHRAIAPMSRNATGAQHAELALIRRPGYEKFVEAVQKTLRDALPPQRPEGPLANAKVAVKDDERLKKEAEKRAKESGRSITVYRRLYPAFGIAPQPTWAKREEGLIPILLAGSWAEGNEADHVALSVLASSDYHSVNNVLARWKNQPDSPLRHIGDTWELAAPLDAWSLLSKAITQDDLDRYKKVALSVLRESDPALTLKSNERYLASFHGKKFKHSSALRRGLVESLIMLSVVAEETLSGSEHAKEVVWRLLGRDAQEDAWASLHELLPQLAEAAPETFLSAVEDSLQKEPSPLLELFESEDRPLGGQFRYPHLLWALEILAWFPDYLRRSASILAQLAKLSPKKEKSLVNRPEKSLREIFCSWHPNTTASLDQRLEVIDSLIEFEDSDVVWDLLLKLLPKLHDVGATNAEPKWRALPDKTTQTYGEIWLANEQIISRTMKKADLRLDRLLDLIEQTRTWSPEQRAGFLARLHEFASSPQPPDALTTLWNAARDFVAHNRTYKFLDEAEMVRWDELLQRVEPEDPIESHIWLFESEVPALTHPRAHFTQKHVDEDNSGVKATEARMDECSRARSAAASLIFDRCGLKGLLSLASRSKAPYLVGQAAAQASNKDELDFEFIEKALEGSDAKVRTAGMAFAMAKNESKGSAWTQSILDSTRFRVWTAEMQAAFCRTLPENRTTWNLVESLGPEVQDIFWKTVAVFLVRVTADEDAEYAISRLLVVGRAFDAVDQAGFVPQRLSPQLLVNVLDKVFECLSNSQQSSSHLISHDIEDL